MDMDRIINQEFIPHAKENGLVMFCWLPHTMHETDQLDNSVFKPLKQNWQKVCTALCKQIPHSAKLSTGKTFLAFTILHSVVYFASNFFE